MTDEASRGRAQWHVPRRVVLAHEADIALPPLTVRPALRQIVHADGRDEIVEPKVMEVLVALLAADGAILTRSDLCEAAWDGRIVGDDAINRILARLRRLSEGIGAGVFHVETIIKVGHRLVLADPVPLPSPPAEGPPSLAVASSPARTPAPALPPVVAAAAPPAAAPRPLGRRLLIGGAVAVVAAGFGGWRLWRGRAVAADSVAVLPFANLSGDPAQAYFSDGIAEELRCALSRIVRLQVAARTSSELMRTTDVPAAAARLGVADIVAGSVRRGPDTIRVTAQLIDGRTGLERWSGTFDRAAGDALTIETSIAERVAATLDIFLGAEEKRLLTAGGTANATARDAYLRGIALDADQKRPAALAAFDAAVAADPDFALARAARAGLLARIAMSETDTADRAGLRAAEAEARRAIALAPGIGGPYAELGRIQQNQFRLRDASAAFAAAYARSPGDATVLWRCADAAALLGRAAEALRLVRLAQRLDPLSGRSLVSTGYILLHTGHVDAAVATLRAELARVPGHPDSLEELGYALVAAGRPAEAMTAAAALPPDAWQRALIEGMATARLGDRAASDRALAALAGEDDIAFQLAELHAQRGEPDLAFAALDRGFRDRDTGLLQMKSDPLLAPLHGDPRFAALLRRIGFPAA